MAASRYTSIRKEVDALLKDGVGAFLDGAVHDSDTHAASLVLGQQLTKASEAYTVLRESSRNETIDCTLMALTKSGKSTVINALVGGIILPSNNIPETARIVSLEHKLLGPDEKPTLTYKQGPETIQIEGERKIHAELERLNKEVRSRQHSKSDEQILAISTQMAALLNETGDQECRLRLLDTPGTNEANEDRLRHSVERLLDSVDAVVYILDYTKLKTTEEANLLTKLKEVNPQLVQRLAQRLFFVVNKIDSMRNSEGLQEQEMREYVADLITKQMGLPAFQLSPDQVMLVSAQDALLARLVLLNKARDPQLKMFGNKAWGSAWARKVNTKTEAEMKEQAAQMLEESHILQLEERLFSYMYRNAGGLKLLSLLDNISRLLAEIYNGAATGLAALHYSTAELERESIDLTRTLSSTLKRFDAVQSEANQIGQDVIEDVQARMQTLKERLFAHVTEVADGVEEPRLPAVKAGPWRKAWLIAVKFLRQGPGQETQNASELREKLQELHTYIQDQVSNEITHFWHDLEVSTNQKHIKLVRSLNRHLDKLIRDLETSIGMTFKLELKQIHIRMDPPSAEAFHKSIQELFEAGIVRNTQTQKQSREIDVTVFERRWRGLCNLTEYYEGVPSKKTEEYDAEVTTFQLRTEKVKEYFQDMVNTAVDTSIKFVRSYVRTYLSDNIKQARDKIQKYGKVYSDTMQATLDVKSMGLEEQETGRKALERQLITITSLLETCNTLQDQVDEFMAEAASPSPKLAEPQSPPAASCEVQSDSAFTRVEAVRESIDTQSAGGETDLVPGSSQSVQEMTKQQAEREQQGGEQPESYDRDIQAEEPQLTLKKVLGIVGGDVPFTPSKDKEQPHKAPTPIERTATASTQDGESIAAYSTSTDGSDDTESEGSRGDGPHDSVDIRSEEKEVACQKTALPVSSKEEGAPPIDNGSIEVTTPKSVTNSTANIPLGAHDEHEPSTAQTMPAPGSPTSSGSWECLSDGSLLLDQSS